MSTINSNRSVMRMPRNRVGPILLSTLILIPGTTIRDWQVEKYDHIKTHEITLKPTGMTIHVQDSASPIMYLWKQAYRISGFQVSGRFSGLPQFQEPQRQGLKGSDDYPLRIGFIVPGDKRLNRMQRFFSAQWIQRLYTSLPQGMGLDRVAFYNVTQRPDQLGHTRVHPDSDLIQESFFALVRHDGPFAYRYQFPTPIDAVGVWLSMDGDDSHSSYTVEISSLTIETK